MLRDLVEEAVQSFPSGLDEVIVEALHHAFHHKLLRQRLKTKRETMSGLVLVQGGFGQSIEDYIYIVFSNNIKLVDVSGALRVSALRVKNV